jgi:deoxyribodipyrimidine photo-lyase
MSRYNLALHIFRRDLRLPDNTALLAAMREAAQVVTCFIVDDRQVTPHPYQSQNGLAFMVESLDELATDVERHGGRLLVCRGDPARVVTALVRTLGLDAVFLNRDYTPFSLARDTAIEDACIASGVACHAYDDALLAPPDEVHKDDGDPYTVFTPFYKRARQRAVPLPQRTVPRRFTRAAAYSGPTISPQAIWPAGASPTRTEHGGRTHGMATLAALAQYSPYATARDRLDLAGTTRLSAHHKFGTLSIRESYHSIAGALGEEHPLLRQLYWRDFFTQIAWHFPHVFGHAFQRKYEHLEWRGRDTWFEAWCEGRTGFPIVDAGMRELAATGYMHNRARMIVASFLVKDLHLDWRRGERWFAQSLTDYDPAVNNGSWQWAASTGCDAQPYFRVFNPWLQQKRFDPDGVYIHRWIPELADVPPEALHRWHTAPLFQHARYPRPLIEHDTQKAGALEMFQRGPA